ncbi:MAG: hypothetical protein GF313_14875, partial [Caldithrix sp.]|nr:hypothetical protein [Caldithrix sp.]
MKHKWQYIYLGLLASMTVGLHILTAQNQLSLKDALEEAMQKNPTLASLEENVSAAKAEVWTSRTGHFPVIAANGNYTRFEEPNIITPIHEVGVFPPLDDRIYEGNIQARVPIFNEGRTLMATRTAKTDLATAQAQHTEKIMGIMQNVTILYLKAYRLRDQQQFVHRQLQALRQRYYEVKMRVQEGRQSTNELALL